MTSFKQLVGLTLVGLVVVASGCVSNSANQNNPQTVDNSPSPEYTEGPKYDGILDLKVISGDLTYIAEKTEPDYISFLVQDGSKTGPVFDTALGLKEVASKPAYKAENSTGIGSSKVFLVHGNKVIDTGFGYHSMLSFDEVNGKLAYNKKTSQGVKVKHGDFISKAYEGAREVTGIGGKLAYKAFNGENYFVVLDGEKQTEYGTVRQLTDVDGKLAYYASEGGVLDDKKEFVVFEGEKGPKYGDIWSLREINGKLAYFAEKDGKQFLVYDGEERRKFDKVESLTEVDGKPAYAATENGNSFAYYQGEKYGQEYKAVHHVYGVNGKLVYEPLTAKNKPGPIVYNGKEIGKQYSGAADLTQFKGNLVFVARNDDTDKEFTVKMQN